MASKQDAPLKIYDAAEETSKKGFFNSIRRLSMKMLLVIGILLFGLAAIVSTVIVAAHLSSKRVSEAEYEELRSLAGDITASADEQGTVSWSELDAEMRSINPDFVCWIKIDGTNIDYPVVRGNDNEHYINTSFYGESNKAGALFMDYRIVSDSIPHLIIYGHNLIEGGMFTDLRKFLDDRFLNDNNIITLTLNGTEVEFVIFSARLSDIEDPAYDLNIANPRHFARFADRVDAPLAATQILTLSTCSNEGDDDVRMIVQGYRLYD